MDKTGIFKLPKSFNFLAKVSPSERDDRYSGQKVPCLLWHARCIEVSHHSGDGLHSPSYWSYSLFPALSAPVTLLHSILFAALLFQFLTTLHWRSSKTSPRFAPLGVSWQELFYRVSESASRPTRDWWIRPPYLCPHEAGRSSYTPEHWESILIASYNARNTLGIFSFPATTGQKGLYYYYYYYISSSSSTMTQRPIIGLDLTNMTYSPLSIHSFSFQVSYAQYLLEIILYYLNPSSFRSTYRPSPPIVLCNIFLCARLLFACWICSAHFSDFTLRRAYIAAHHIYIHYCIVLSLCHFLLLIRIFVSV